MQKHPGEAITGAIKTAGIANVPWTIRQPHTRDRPHRAILEPETRFRPLNLPDSTGACCAAGAQVCSRLERPSVEDGGDLEDPVHGRAAGKNHLDLVIDFLAQEELPSNQTQSVRDPYLHPNAIYLKLPFDIRRFEGVLQHWVNDCRDSYQG